MYESPIKVFCINTELQKLEDEAVFRAVRNLGFLIDQDELIRALQYDRDQYDKGYRDARESLMTNGVRVMKWIPASEPPREFGEYIVAIKYGVTATTLYYSPEDGIWFEPDGFSDYAVTHWMPMPEIVREEGAHEPE